MKSVPRRKKHRRKLRWGRVILALFLVFVLIVGIAGVGAYYYIDYRLNHGTSTYIAVMGTDERPSDTNDQRSDVIMLAHIDFTNSQVNLISLPRDSYVSIPCEDNSYDKITHSYAYGGSACTIETLEGVFELDDIPNYAIVNFDSVIEMVDELGGITLTPTKTFCELSVDKQREYCYTKGQTMEMDGETALTYARHRHSDSDIYRTQRTQEVLTAMMVKAKSLDLWHVYQLGAKVLGQIKTNISILDALTYYKLVQRDNFSLTRETADGEDSYIDGVYYYQLDDDWLNDIKARLHNEN